MKKLIVLTLTLATLLSTSFAGVELTNKELVSQDSFYNSNELTLGVSAVRQVQRGNDYGAGLDIKYFINRNFGLGIEGLYFDTEKASGAVMATETYRYPITDRLAPYGFAGVGANGNRHKAVLAGQLGMGLEYRFTRNVGVMADYSYNLNDGPRNNFGLIKVGLNTAF